jgi:hypothetical protein
MANNSPKQSRKKLYEDYEDSLFRLLLDEAAEQEGQGYLEERERLKGDPESVPSKEAFQKFSRQLDVCIKKKNASLRNKRILRALNRAAVAMLIIVVLLFGGVTSVKALRIRVMNFLIEIQPEYTSVQLKDSDDPSGGEDGGNQEINWHQGYAPAYIPDGYIVAGMTDSERYKKIIWDNQQGSLIIYEESAAGANLGLDTENAESLKTITISGHEGLLAVKDSVVSIVWNMEDRMFSLRAQTSEDIAVNIAESVKYTE